MLVCSLLGKCLWHLQDCDITSITGSGVCSEGGQLEVSRCRIHNCKQHGIALFRGLDGQDGRLQTGPSLDPSEHFDCI